MDLPRFYCPELARAGAAPGGPVVLDAAESRHARRSLRLRAGDTIELFDGRGGVALGRIRPDSIPGSAEAGGQVARRGGKRRATIQVQIDTLRHATPPARTLALIVAGCKGARLDFLVEKGTELGVTAFRFARFARSVVEPGAAHVEKLRRTTIEACKQCGRNHIPEISAGDDLLAAARDARAPAGAALVVAHTAEDARPFGQWLFPEQPRHLIAVIGPEGGLTDDELAALCDLGAIPIRLGEHVLRVETAALATAAAFSGA